MDPLKSFQTLRREGGLSTMIAREFLASIVVFLVALPLCMGIAIASGVPPALGLVTGIIGGLFVGFIAGQPLQVSGPAAGLAVLVWEIVAQFGLAGLAIATFIAGMMQLVAGLLRTGRLFRAVTPAVILGMLGGIGVLIFASQFHVMMDHAPGAGGLTNLMSIPVAIYEGILLPDSQGTVHQQAAAIGLLTIVSLVLWERFRPASVKAVPGALVGVVMASGVAGALGLTVTFVEVPEDLWGSLQGLSFGDTSFISQSSFWIATFGLALIASAETLLCATAVDRMHDGPRTNYDKELWSQGLGNMLCGLVGALPMTGVIVRSSANVEAGGKTRLSAILHSVWILVLVLFAPSLLGLIPVSALAAILVYTGYRLLNLAAVRLLLVQGRDEFLIWLGTVSMIVATDLLIGVAFGIALSMLRLVYTFTHLDIAVVSKDGRQDVTLRGAATFVSLPKLAKALEELPNSDEVHVHIDQLAYIDHACFEVIEGWRTRHKSSVYVESDALIARSQARPTFVAGRKAG